MRARLLISWRNRYKEMEPTFTATDGGPSSLEVHLQEGMAPFHTFLPTHSRMHYNIDLGDLFNADKEAEMEATDHMLSICSLDDSDEEHV